MTFADDTQVNSGTEHVTLFMSLHISANKWKAYQNNMYKQFLREESYPSREHSVGSVGNCRWTIEISRCNKCTQ